MPFANPEKRREYRRLYRLKNLDHLTTYQKEYYASNKDAVKARQRRYNKANAVELNLKKRAYTAAHPEEIKERKRLYRRDSAEKIRRKNQSYCFLKRKTDPIFKLREYLRGRLGSAIRRHRAGKMVSSVRDLGCTLVEFIGYLETQFKSGMCWDNYGSWHVDHIRPLSSFDLTNREQQLAAVNYRNLQPLWAKENISKGSRWIGV